MVKATFLLIVSSRSRFNGMKSAFRKRRFAKLRESLQHLVKISDVNSKHAGNWDIVCLVFGVVRFALFGKGGHALFLIRRAEQPVEQATFEF